MITFYCCCYFDFAFVWLLVAVSPCLKDVENVTATARNFKSFPKFVKMLFDGLKRTSTSVTLELLTRSQLELVCQRKKRQSLSSTSSVLSSPFQSSMSSPQMSSPGDISKDNNVRYLDMVYHAEYDLVHYPLPLSYVRPDAERL